LFERNALVVRLVLILIPDLLRQVLFEQRIAIFWEEWPVCEILALLEVFTADSSSLDFLGRSSGSI